LLTAYAQAGKKAEAAALLAAQVQTARKQFPASSPKLAAALADVGKAVLDGKAYADAEPLLRESLTLSEHHAPDAWETDQARSLLGGALLGQRKYADAEPLLFRGYEGMKRRAEKVPAQAKVQQLRETLERLVRLYDAWDKPDEAAKWRKELEKAKE
jgi:hypothetical protein